MNKLPEFILGGAQKSGTTSLHYYLNQHPDIFLHTGKLQEIHYFDDPDNYKKGIDWYVTFFKDIDGHRLIGQNCPAYMYFDYVPERIYKVMPGVKFIFILRNPVDRAYSHYWHVWRKNRERKKFEVALKLENERILLGYRYKRNYSYLSRGKYMSLINNYLEYFSRSQILIIIYEEFVKNPNFVLEKCFNFLEVESNFHVETSIVYNKAKIPRNRLIRKFLTNRYCRKIQFLQKIDNKFNYRIRYPEMIEKTKNELNTYYKNDIRELQTFLDKDLSFWYK